MVGRVDDNEGSVGAATVAGVDTAETFGSFSSELFPALAAVSAECNSFSSAACILSFFRIMIGAAG